MVTQEVAMLILTQIIIMDYQVVLQTMAQITKCKMTLGISSAVNLILGVPSVLK